MYPVTTLKDVLHMTVMDSPVPTRQLAEELGISYQMLMNAQNPHLEDFKLQARLVVPLCKLTGDVRLIEFMAQSCGLVVLPMPTAPHSMRDLQSNLADTVKEFGDLIQETGTAMKDGRIDDYEAKRIEKEARELVSRVMEFVTAVGEAVED